MDYSPQGSSVHGIFLARILECVAISSSSRPCFVRTLTMTCPSWVALHSMAHSFTELCKPLHQDKAVIHEGNTWSEKFQMFKLGFKEAGEQEIKLSMFTESWRKQRSSRKTFNSASFTKLIPLTVWIPTNGKILKEMGIPDHLTCLLRNLYVSQEATVTIGHGTTGSKLGKEYDKAVYHDPAYLTYMQSTSCEIPG